MNENAPESGPNPLQRSDVVASVQQAYGGLENPESTKKLREWLHAERAKLTAVGEQHIDIRLDSKIGELYRDLGMTPNAYKTFLRVAEEAAKVGATEFSETLREEAEKTIVLYQDMQRSRGDTPMSREEVIESIMAGSYKRVED